MRCSGGGRRPGGLDRRRLPREGQARVVCVGHARSPRFHIGESPLPASLPLVERLGVRQRMAFAGRLGIVLHQRALRPLWLRARLECVRLAVWRAGRLRRPRG